MSRGFSVQPRAARVKSALRPDRTSNYATSVHLGRYGLPMEREGDVVADGRVDREKLAELLALGAEQEALDFKATLDLSDPKHQVDHIKDILSMMSLLDGGISWSASITLAASRKTSLQLILDSSILLSCFRKLRPLLTGDSTSGARSTSLITSRAKDDRLP